MYVGEAGFSPITTQVATARLGLTIVRSKSLAGLGSSRESSAEKRCSARSGRSQTLTGVDLYRIFRRNGFDIAQSKKIKP
jgi:hypothetical protein